MPSYKHTRKNKRHSKLRKTRHRGRRGLRRKQVGGVSCADIANPSIKQVCKGLQAQRSTKFASEVPAGDYTIYWKALQPITTTNDKSLYKVCHNYSLFSLLGGDTEIGMDSSYVQTLLASCPNGGTCNSTGILPARTNTMSKQISTFPVRLYTLKNSNGPIAHSSRFEGGRWWHKFNGVNALVSIEGQEDFFKYNKVSEFTLTAYKVPAEMFENGVETIESAVMTIV